MGKGSFQNLVVGHDACVGPWALWYHLLSKEMWLAYVCGTVDLSWWTFTQQECCEGPSNYEKELISTLADCATIMFGRMGTMVLLAQ
jgi:hypothetical protein